MNRELRNANHKSHQKLDRGMTIVNSRIVSYLPFADRGIQAGSGQGFDNQCNVPMAIGLTQSTSDALGLL